MLERIEPPTDAEMDAWRASLETGYSPLEEERQNVFFEPAPPEDLSVAVVTVICVVVVACTFGLALLAMPFGFIAKEIAERRGQPPMKWFLAGCVFGPFALIYQWLYAADKTKKLCNICRAPVDKRALICPHCGRDPYGHSK